jgi:hypothetical protein
MMLDRAQLGAYMNALYQQDGDRVFRMERLPWYDVPSQNADRRAFLAGVAPDWSRKQAWLDKLDADRAAGRVSERVRVFGHTLSDDELMSCHYGIPPLVRHGVRVRVLHRSEHPVADLLDHDYWIAEPAAGGVYVVRMHYSDGGALLGAESIEDRTVQAVYLHARESAWADAEEWDSWWDRHGELHRELAA